MSEASIGRWLMIAAGLVVVATVLAAVAVMGLPSKQREIRLDERRVGDLERITTAIESHAERRGALPPDLATLARQPGRRLSLTDPVVGSAYEYAVTGDRTYRLCAVFTTDTARQPQTAVRIDDEWLHATGRQCFDRKLKHRSKDD